MLAADDSYADAEDEDGIRYSCQLMPIKMPPALRQDS